MDDRWQAYFDMKRRADEQRQQFEQQQAAHQALMDTVRIGVDIIIQQQTNLMLAPLYAALRAREAK